MRQQRARLARGHLGDPLSPLGAVPAPFGARGRGGDKGRGSRFPWGRRFLWFKCREFGSGGQSGVRGHGATRRVAPGARSGGSWSRGSAEMMGCGWEGWDWDPGKGRCCPPVSQGKRDPKSDGGTGHAAVPAVALGTRGMVASHHPGRSLLLLLLIPAESHKEPPQIPAVPPSRCKSQKRGGTSGFSLKKKNKPTKKKPQIPAGTLRVLPGSPPPLWVPGAVAACGGGSDGHRKTPGLEPGQRPRVGTAAGRGWPGVAGGGQGQGVKCPGVAEDRG